MTFFNVIMIWREKRVRNFVDILRVLSKPLGDYIHLLKVFVQKESSYSLEKRSIKLTPVYDPGLFGHPLKSS